VAVPLAVLVGFTLPHAAAEQEMLQVTPLLPASLVTVAVNWAVAVARTVALPGETETVMAGTVIVAELDLVESATEVALTVTVRVLAGGPGAV